MMNPHVGSMEPILVPEEPSPWWHWGPAIAITFITLLGAISIVVTAIFPANDWMDWYPEPDRAGEYPENGSSEEQQQWNNTNDQWGEWNSTKRFFDEIEESGIQETQMMVTSLLTLSAVPVIALLVTRHRHAFNATAIWIILKASLESWLSYEMKEMMTSMVFNYYPEGASEAAAWIYLLSGTFQIICCNLTLLTLVVICSMKAINESTVPESGYHHS